MNATATMAPAGSSTTVTRTGGASRTSGGGGPQYLRALERANQVRLARAELKRRIATGELDIANVILECPQEVSGMTVLNLLMSQYRWGSSRTRKLLVQLQMPENKPLGSLTDRQRRTLAEACHEQAPMALGR